MNMFQGVKVPIPCNTRIKKMSLNRSDGGSHSSFARSIVIFLKLSSSSGRFLASHAGVSLTGSVDSFRPKLEQNKKSIKINEIKWKYLQLTPIKSSFHIAVNRSHDFSPITLFTKLLVDNFSWSSLNNSTIATKQLSLVKLNWLTVFFICSKEKIKKYFQKYKSLLCVRVR